MVQTTITTTGGIDEVVQTIRQLATPQPDIAATAISIMPPAPTPAAPQLNSQAEPPPAGQPRPLQQDDAPTAETETALPPSWTTETAATLLSGVTDHAAQIIRYLAEHNPPAVSTQQVRTDLELEPNQIRNARISAGNRARRNGLPTPAIGGRNDTLSIHPDLAQAIRSVLDQHPTAAARPQPLAQPAAARIDRSSWGLHPITEASAGR